MAYNIVRNPDDSIDIHLDTLQDLNSAYSELSDELRFYNQSDADLDRELDSLSQDDERNAASRARLMAEKTKREGREQVAGESTQ